MSQVVQVSVESAQIGQSAMATAQAGTRLSTPEVPLVHSSFTIPVSERAQAIEEISAILAAQLKIPQTNVVDHLARLSGLEPADIENLMVGAAESGDISDAGRTSEQTFRAQIHKNVNLKESSPITQIGTGPPDEAADWSMLIRTFYGIFDDTPLFAAMGFTTAFNAIQGAAAVWKSYKRLQTAIPLNDFVNKLEARTDIARGVFQGLGGVGYAAFRALTIAVQQTGASPSSALALANTQAANAGNAAFAAFYVALGVNCGVNIYLTSRVVSKLLAGTENIPQEHLKQARMLENLKKYLMPTPKRVLEKMRANLTDLQVKAALKKEAYDKYYEGMKNIKKHLKDKANIDKSIPSRERCREIVERLFLRDLDLAEKQELLRQLGIAENSEQGRFCMGLSALEFEGLIMKHKKMVARREYRIARGISGECLQAIKQACTDGTIESLRVSDTTLRDAAVNRTKTAIGRLKETAVDNKKVCWIFIATCVLGVIATILGFVFTAGIVPLIANIFFILVASGMLYNDIVLTQAAVAAGAPEANDKKNVVASTILCLIAYVVSIVVLQVTGPILIACTAIFIAWGLANAIYLYRIEKNKSTDKDKLLEALNSPQSSDVQIKLFYARLNQADLIAIDIHLHQDGIEHIDTSAQGVVTVEQRNALKKIITELKIEEAAKLAKMVAFLNRVHAQREPAQAAPVLSIPRSISPVPLVRVASEGA